MNKIIKDLEEGIITLETIISNVVCRKCGKTLPDHTVLEHFNEDFMTNLHTCGVIGEQRPEMKTIKFKTDGQDNANLYSLEGLDIKSLFEKGSLSYYDYEEVLKFSIAWGFISDAKDIKTFYDGSDHMNPYFTSETLEDEVDNYLGNYECIVE